MLLSAAYCGALIGQWWQIGYFDLADLFCYGAVSLLSLTHIALQIYDMGLRKVYFSGEGKVYFSGEGSALSIVFSLTQLTGNM